MRFTLSSSLLEKKLEAVCKVLMEDADCGLFSGLGGMLYSLSLNTKVLDRELRAAANRQESSLVNEVSFDASKVQTAINGALETFSNQSGIEELKLMASDTDWLDLTEDEEQLGTIYDSIDEGRNVRLWLSRQIPAYYEALKNNVGSMTTSLDRIRKHNASINRDKEYRIKVFHRMEKQYENDYGRQHRERFIDRMKYLLTLPGNSGRTMEDIVAQELKGMRYRADSYEHNRLLARLFSTVEKDDVEQAASLMVKERERIDEDMVNSYFEYRDDYRMLQAHLDAFELLKPVSGTYDRLFTSQAAMEYVRLMVPYLNEYALLERVGHYSVMQMAMADLGLAIPNHEGRNSIQLQLFVCHDMLGDKDSFKDNSSLTKVSSKLNGETFGKLDTDHLNKTNMTVSDYNRYKEVYWQCTSILNITGLVDFRKCGWAKYLQQPHAVVNRMIKDGVPNENDRRRLFYLSSVIRREILFR